MEYVYATLMLNETGEEINEANLTATLDAAGATITQSRVKALVASLEGVNIDDVARQAGIAPELPGDQETNGGGERSAAPGESGAATDEEHPGAEDPDVDEADEGSSDDALDEEADAGSDQSRPDGLNEADDRDSHSAGEDQ